MRTIKVNGTNREVLDALSCGPGCTPHTYELRNGAYVYAIAGEWFLQERGQGKRSVTVTPDYYTAKEMAALPHNLSRDGMAATLKAGVIYKWSAPFNVWAGPFPV